MASKKERKICYKELKFKVGVFQIRNISNHKIYVEGSTDLVAASNKNKFQLRYGLHSNSKLQLDWNEFGEEKFVYEILSKIVQDDTNTADYRKEAKQLESMFIEEIQPFDQRGYDIRSK